MRTMNIVFAILLVLWPAAEVAAGNESSCTADDYESSLQTFMTLADEGNPTAQFLLGVMYAEGKGVQQDFVTAYFWLSMSAEQGDLNAASLLDIVVQRMTTDTNGPQPRSSGSVD